MAGLDVFLISIVVDNNTNVRDKEITMKDTYQFMLQAWRTPVVETNGNDEPMVTNEETNDE
jgi:hypothetical protein